MGEFVLHMAATTVTAIQMYPYSVFQKNLKGKFIIHNIQSLLIKHSK